MMISSVCKWRRRNFVSPVLLMSKNTFTTLPPKTIVLILMLNFEQFIALRMCYDVSKQLHFF